MIAYLIAELITVHFHTDPDGSDPRYESSILLQQDTEQTYGATYYRPQHKARRVFIGALATLANIALSIHVIQRGYGALP